MTWLALLVTACVGCAGGGTSAADSEGEWVREYDGVVPGTERERFVAVRVIDRASGRPVVGARVAQHEGGLDPKGNWAPLIAESETDEYGIATMQEHPSSNEITVSANGYAPSGVWWTSRPRIVELSHGREHAGIVVHPDGRPAAGMRLSHKFGNAHSPDLAHAVTDQDGRFVFSALTDAEITYEDPRFLADYLGRALRPLRWGPPTIWMLPGSVIRGRVVKRDGSVPDWAVVHAGGRAPRTLVARDGTFTLRGVAPGANLTINWRDETTKWGIRYAHASLRTPGAVTVFVLDVDQWQRPDTVRHHIDVRVRDTKGNVLINFEGDCPVHLDRPSDGSRDTTELGPYDFWAEAGSYLLSAGTHNSRYYAPTQRIKITGPTTEDSPLEITVLENARLEIVIEPAAGDPPPNPREPKYIVQLSDRFWEVDAGDVSYLPPHHKATVRVELGDQTFLFPVGAVNDGVRRATISLPGAKQLRFPELEGEFVAYLLWDWDGVGALDWEDTPPTRWTLSTGKHWLCVTHRDKGVALRELDLPWEASEPIEIRDLEFSAVENRELRIVDGSGQPIKHAWASVHPTPFVPGYEFNELNEGERNDGVERSEYFRDRAWVRFGGSSDFPTRYVQLEGNGPYLVQFGSAEIEIDMRAYGESAVICDSERHPLREEHQTTFVHLDAGPHTLLIGATGFVPQVHRVILTEGERRRIAPRLRKRTP